MELKTTDDGIYLLLKRGEKLMQSLTELASLQKIASASIVGISALMEVEFGFYHLYKKAYERRLFPDEYELVSLQGNVTWFEGKPIVHCHAAIGDRDFKIHGGHLFEAHVAVVTELFLTTRPERLERKFSEHLGLNIWCPSL